MMPEETPPDAPDEFTSLLTKLARVPKEEIEAREREYRETRDSSPPAKPGEIVPTTRER
jgi:hypothetical protein